MNFGSDLVWGVRSIGVELCMVFLLMVLSRFDRLGGGMECVMGYLPSEVGMVTPYEECVNGMLFRGVVSTDIIPGMFDLVTRWCVRGAKIICVGAVGFDDGWVIYVSVNVTWSAVSPNIFR